jgi:hypothetical protein
MKCAEKRRTGDLDLLQNAAKPSSGFCVSSRHAFRPVFMRVRCEGGEKGVKSKGMFFRHPSRYVVENNEPRFGDEPNFAPTEAGSNWQRTRGKAKTPCRRCRAVRIIPRDHPRARTFPLPESHSSYDFAGSLRAGNRGAGSCGRFGYNEGFEVTSCQPERQRARKCSPNTKR